MLITENIYLSVDKYFAGSSVVRLLLCEHLVDVGSHRRIVQPYTVERDVVFAFLGRGAERQGDETHRADRGDCCQLLHQQTDCVQKEKGIRLSGRGRGDGFDIRQEV